MRSIGDIIVYRHQVCTIAAVREKYFDDKDYFELHSVFSKLKLYVAIEAAVPPAVREVMTTEQALAVPEAMLAVTPLGSEAFVDGASTSSVIERQVKAEYDARMKTGQLEDLLFVIRSAVGRSRRRMEVGHRPTATDKKYGDMAKTYLVDEMAVALNMQPEEAEAFLDDRMDTALS